MTAPTTDRPRDRGPQRLEVSLEVRRRDGTLVETWSGAVAGSVKIGDDGEGGHDEEDD